MTDETLRTVVRDAHMTFEILLRAGASQQQAHRLLDEQSDETRRLVEMRAQNNFGRD